jgi:hypothetical protein
MIKTSRIARIAALTAVLFAGTAASAAPKKPRSQELRESAARHDAKGNTASAEKARSLADHHQKLENIKADREARAAKKAAAKK